MGPTNKELSIIMKMRDEVTKKITTIQGKMIKFGNDIKRHFLGAAAGIAGLLIVVKKFTDAAGREEDAIMRLNNALELQGEFTKDVSNRYQDFATELQRSTRYGNEAIMELMQQLISVGNVAPDQMERATKAAIDFASATGRDLKTAALTVGKAMTGFTGELSRYGIIIDKNIPATEKARAALEAMEKQFGGMAQKDVKTFNGTIEQLGNNFGDLMEALGSFITESPAVKTALEFWSKTFANIADAIKSMRDRSQEAKTQIGEMQKEFDFLQERIDNFHLNAKKSGGYTPKELIKINELITEQARINRTILRMKQEINQEAEKETENNNKKVEQLGKIIEIEEERAKAIEKFSEMQALYSDEEQARFEADLEGRKSLLDEWHSIQRAANATTYDLAAHAIKTFHQGMSNALSDVILGVRTAKEAFSQLGQMMVKMIVDWVVQKAVAMAMEFALSKVMQKFVSKTAVALANAWAPAAALASLATLGGNAVPASIGMAATAGVAYSIANAKPMARGGDEVVTKPTLYLAGEAGPERATFRPLGGPFKGGGMQDGVTIHIGPVYQQPGENVEELARRLGDYAFRQRRYYGLT